VNRHAYGRIADCPADLGRYEGRSTGLDRRTIVDASMGSTHMAEAICTLEPGGAVERHVHAFEEGLYVLEGTLELELGGGSETLGPDEYAYLEVGVPHALGNGGDAPARWIEVGSPQPGAPGLEDTAFVGPDFAGTAGDGAFRRGRFDESRLPEPSGEILAGFGGGNVSGAALEMFVDAELGASQFILFTVRYLPGGAIKPHDHAFEEAYVFVTGEIEATLGGETHTLRAGDWCWTGVGSPHSFANRSDEPVRWIETQAPQPPSRHQARFFGDWEASVAGG
jgi:quercetin dioxygenase-like cupin family protein